MRRRKPKEIRFAQDGPNGRPAAEIVKRWMSQAKRRLNRMERRDGVQQIRRDRSDGAP